MADLGVVVDKLIRMHQYITELQALKPESYQLLTHHKKPPASDYYNSFIDLSECDVFEIQFALAITPSTGLRNRLVHEYEEINDKVVYDSIDVMVDMYSQYMEKVNDALNR